MNNLCKDNEMQLSQFGAYLLRNRLVLERHAPFYVKWVRRFLTEAVVDTAQSPGERLMVLLSGWGPMKWGRWLRRKRRSVCISTFCGSGGGWID